MRASDDVSGATLDPKLVVKAKQLEMDYFRKMGVYHKVPRKTLQQHGGRIIGTRWIDINKGDEESPDYRSRMVGKEFNVGSDPALYAATPPLEALRLIVSRAATTRRGSGKMKVMINDVKRAYFHARATRDVYVELPDEDKLPGEGDLVGKLDLCSYGTRDAASNWQETVAEHLDSCGFQRGCSNPCVFYHPVRDIMTLAHGDDYASAGNGEQMRWLHVELEKRFEIKTTVLGTEAGDLKEGHILDRVLRVAEAGLELEADPRHAKLLIEQLHLDGSKQVSTLGIEEHEEQQED